MIHIDVCMYQECFYCQFMLYDVFECIQLQFIIYIRTSHGLAVPSTIALW